MVISAILKYHTFSVKLILQINSSSYDNQFSYKKKAIHYRFHLLKSSLLFSIMKDKYESL